jgi:mannose-6-phosphate isomerase-like protein (cupin superfamily)
VTDKKYGIAKIEDLEKYPIANQDGLTWRPVRRHFGITSFGVNAYTAEEAGQRVVEEHREKDGHDELYVVLSGRATFTLEGDEHDAPAGTLVHCPPGTLRGAIATEPGTTVIGIGAKAGEVFQPSGWEWSFAAFSLLRQGDEESARAELEAGLAAVPDSWHARYNLACFEALTGNREAALTNLEGAAELEPKIVPEMAATDDDFVSLQDDPRFLAVAGQANTAGASS